MLRIQAALTPSDFVYDKGAGVLFYGGMVIPMTRLAFTKTETTTNPKRRVRPTIVAIGRLTDEGDLKPAEHSFPLPTKDGEPLSGKCTLRLSAGYSALGDLAGEKPVEF